MKLIKQSFEFINQTDFSLVGIKKHIEKCARVSYKSEDKITDTSYEKFVNMLDLEGMIDLLSLVLFILHYVGMMPMHYVIFLYIQIIPGLKYVNKLLEPNMTLTHMLY